MVAVDEPGWPAISTQDRLWMPNPNNRGPRADRLLGHYRAAVVPAISAVAVRLSAPTREAVRNASDAVEMLQSAPPTDLGGLTGAMLRSESVASSKIEHLSARHDDVALALLGVERSHGGRAAAAAAKAVAANISAMDTALRRPGPARGVLEVDDLLDIHRALMLADPEHGDEAGRVRDVQNWIGGSDHSPRDALFVPPPAAALPAGLSDLAAFASRDDVHPLVRAAIAHAQFETLHPFVDGNGRTGRALIHLLWRRSQFAPAVVVPVSTVLLADVGSYFEGLDHYRQGELDLWITKFALATAAAALAGRRLVQQVHELAQTWRDDVRPRTGSAVAVLLDLAIRQPVLDVSTARSASSVDDANLYRAIDRLCAAGVLAEVTGRGRHRVWLAPDVFALLEAFEASVGRRVSPLR